MQNIRPNDVPVESRPSEAIWEVVESEYKAGRARIIQHTDGSYAVHWHDEQHPTPFDALGYHPDLGVYDKRAIEP